MDKTPLGPEHDACYLMLDFDGVLHPLAASPDEYFVCLPMLEAVLRDHPNVQVVITSSWRHVHPLGALRAVFSPDLRSRVVGVTPDLPQTAGEADIGTRHCEVTAWLEARGEQGAPWVALDDVAHLYASGAPLVVAADGFGPTEAKALRDALDDPVAFARRCQA